MHILENKHTNGKLKVVSRYALVHTAVASHCLLITGVANWFIYKPLVHLPIKLRAPCPTTVDVRSPWTHKGQNINDSAEKPEA